MAMNPPAVNTQGRTSQLRSSHRFTSAMSSPSGLLSSIHISQSEMKSQILREFNRATFLVDLTAEGAPLQADSSNVQKVLDRLRVYHNITHHTLRGNDDSTDDVPRFPPNGFTTEPNSYGPLTHFLNIIVRAAKECLTPWAARHLRGLRFLLHGVEMQDKVNSRKPLKPDVLGLVCSPPHQQKISWNDVAIIVEVKSKRLELIQQLSTYARCYLAIDRRRSFSIAIAFNHENLRMRFLIFHRAGLSSSHELSLREEAGFQSVVEHMVGVLSIPDEKAFGLDMARFENVYRINNRDYEIVRPIHVRNSVRGRATVVYSIRVCSPAVQDTPASLQSRWLTLVDGVVEPPKEMVYKLSYQTEGHTLEGSLLSGSLGQFGIVDIIGSYNCTPEEPEPFGSTAQHVKNCTFWKLSKDSAEKATPENRYLHCVAMALEGLPLLDISDKEVGIPSPPELLESILHAMVGHYNLFLGDVLHRDVSNGNILRLREPIERTYSRSTGLLRPELGEDVNLSSCRGLLTDWDHSIEWRKVPPTPSTDRSGTLPFMSLRLVHAWSRNQPALHTAIDDLESFLWVLVWSLVHIFKESTTITNESATINDLAGAFSSYRPRDVISKEFTVRNSWPDEVFGGLIREWLMTCDHSRMILTKLERTLSKSINDADSQKRAWGELEKHCGEVYIKFIGAGYRHLKNVRTYRDWKQVVDEGGELLNQ